MMNYTIRGKLFSSRQQQHQQSQSLLSGVSSFKYSYNIIFINTSQHNLLCTFCFNVFINKFKKKKTKTSKKSQAGSIAAVKEDLKNGKQKYVPQLGINFFNE